MVTSEGFSFELPSLEHSECFATHLAPCLFLPMVITLSGEIGSGKTTLVRALLRTLGVQGAIKSPTYSLLESYDLSITSDPGSQAQCHHFDLYRIQEESELEFIGFREHFQAHTLCLIEWPERIALDPSQIDLALTLKPHHAGRLLQIQTNAKSVSIINKCVHNFKKEQQN